MFLFCFVIHTANMLGVFSDPFEFEGSYGSDQEPLRQKVFECVVAKEFLVKNFSDEQVRKIYANAIQEHEMQSYRDRLIQKAIEEDRMHGPTLGDLIPPKLVEVLKEKQKALQESGFTKAQLEEIVALLQKNQDKKIFHFMRHCPSQLLKLDKKLRDKAVENGESLELSILSSMGVLKGENSLALKQNLLEELFTESTLRLAQDSKELENVLGDFFFLGEKTNAFYSPAGQVFFYWMYQALNLHLVSQDFSMIGEINQAKERFKSSMGNPQARADFFKNRVLQAGSSVVFTQESDTIVMQTFTKEGDFFLPKGQNLRDGTVVFLRSDMWECSPRVIPLEEYKEFFSGKINLILATERKTGRKFLLATGHGDSNRPEDGRLQMSLIMKKFYDLLQDPVNAGLQLLIGIDANTKTEEDVKKFQEHANQLGLICTKSGPTTIKKRMVTVQHTKSGRAAVDEEDYLLTLSPEKGGRYSFSHLSIGFEQHIPDLSVFLPSAQYPFDHYAVGVTLEDLNSK